MSFFGLVSMGSVMVRNWSLFKGSIWDMGKDLKSLNLFLRWSFHCMRLKVVLGGERLAISSDLLSSFPLLESVDVGIGRLRDGLGIPCIWSGSRDSGPGFPAFLLARVVRVFLPLIGVDISVCWWYSKDIFVQLISESFE